jgi:hypothetical protein
VFETRESGSIRSFMSGPSSRSTTCTRTHGTTGPELAKHIEMLGSEFLTLDSARQCGPIID